MSKPLGMYRIGMFTIRPKQDSWICNWAGTGVYRISDIDVRTVRQTGNWVESTTPSEWALSSLGTVVVWHGHRTPRLPCGWSHKVWLKTCRDSRDDYVTSWCKVNSHGAEWLGQALKLRRRWEGRDWLTELATRHLQRLWRWLCTDSDNTGPPTVHTSLHKPSPLMHVVDQFDYFQASQRTDHLVATVSLSTAPGPSS